MIPPESKMEVSYMKTALYKNKEWLEKELKEGKTKTELAKSLNVSSDTIAYWQNKHCIPSPKRIKKKYELDCDFFAKIDTEEKAYWLGFIMADGCISTSNKKCPNSRLDIVLNENDNQHLNKVKKALQSTAPIENKVVHDKRGFSTNSSRIRFSSVVLCRDLIKWGVVPQKTGKEIMPDIENDLLRHFIRGFFDGDGTICCQYKTDKRYRFHIGSASLLIIKQIISYFKTFNIELKYYTDLSYKKPFYYIDSNSHIITQKVMHILYDDAKIYLDRKYNIVQTCFKISPPIQQ